MKVEEAFKNYSKKIQKGHEEVVRELVGIEGDPQVYYFILDNGVKIGIAKVYLESDEEGNAKVEEENRQKCYRDEGGKYILRFQFLDWPKK